MMQTKVYEIILDGKFVTTIREISEFCAINKFKKMWEHQANSEIKAIAWREE